MSAVWLVDCVCWYCKRSAFGTASAEMLENIVASVIGIHIQYWKTVKHMAGCGSSFLREQWQWTRTRWIPGSQFVISDRQLVGSSASRQCRLTESEEILWRIAALSGHRSYTTIQCSKMANQYHKNLVYQKHCQADFSENPAVCRIRTAVSYRRATGSRVAQIHSLFLTVPRLISASGPSVWPISFCRVSAKAAASFQMVPGHHNEC